MVITTRLAVCEVELNSTLSVGKESQYTQKGSQISTLKIVDDVSPWSTDSEHSEEITCCSLSESEYKCRQSSFPLPQTNQEMKIPVVLFDMTSNNKRLVTNSTIGSGKEDEELAKETSGELNLYERLVTDSKLGKGAEDEELIKISDEFGSHKRLATSSKLNGKEGEELAKKTSGNEIGSHKRLATNSQLEKGTEDEELTRKTSDEIGSHFRLATNSQLSDEEYEFPGETSGQIGSHKQHATNSQLGNGKVFIFEELTKKASGEMCSHKSLATNSKLGDEALTRKRSVQINSHKELATDRKSRRGKEDAEPTMKRSKMASESSGISHKSCGSICDRKEMGTQMDNCGTDQMTATKSIENIATKPIARTAPCSTEDKATSLRPIYLSKYQCAQFKPTTTVDASYSDYNTCSKLPKKTHRQKSKPRQK